MAKFITGHELEKTICDIIWEAKETLLIVSPFIKLDSFFADHFRKQLDKPLLHLVVVFGKNEYDKSKSLNKDDFEFFKGFQKVSIIYKANLHAKYYGNESKGVITSINLYDHSFRNNIEFGVYTDTSLISNLTQSTDKDAWHASVAIAKSGEPVFIKRPVYKKKMLGILGKDYISTTVLLDNTEAFYAYGNKRLTNKKMDDFEDEFDAAELASVRPTREEFAKTVVSHVSASSSSFIPIGHAHKLDFSDQSGYCIRTGVAIPFNLSRPYSDDAYRSWARYKNPNYKEKYCHKTGNESHGKTTMNNPVL